MSGFAPLADFDRPPVVETILSVQFEKLTTMQAVHFGVFWRGMQAQFPVTSEHLPLPPVIELFPESPQQKPRVRFEALEKRPLSRLWLVDAAGSELIQLQNDRFIKNWRKQADHDRYPNYEPVIKPAFERDFQHFESFVAEERLGAIKITQCEVSYINHIVSGDGWDDFSEFQRIFTVGAYAQAPIPGRADEFAIRLRFPIHDDRGQPIGRLHVEIEPALHAADNRRMYVLNLTARGQAGNHYDFFDIGRRWIVNAFEQLTTEHMHRFWRKK